MEQFVHLHSRYRENYYSSSCSDFVIKFPYTIKNITETRIVSIDFPASWYNISEKRKNNYFFIRTHRRETVENKFTENKLWKISIPDGTWSNYDITNYLNNTYFNTAEEFSELSYLRFFLDTKTLKITFELVEGVPFDYKYDLIFKTDQPLYKSLGWILGFRSGEYKNINKNIIRIHKIN